VSAGGTADADVVAAGSELPGLTGIVPAFNEEPNLDACLGSFRDLCDELIVVDSFSADQTLEIARRHGARTYQREWVDYRTFLHFALPRARHRFVLIVDCDERVSAALREEIRARIAADGGGYDGFEMLRVNHFLGRRIRYGGWQNDTIQRFFRKGRGGPREREVHPGIVIDGRVERLRGPMLHFPYPTLDDYFQKFNRYTSAAARDRLRAGERATPFALLFAAPLRFLKNYVIRLGLLDGYPGFVLAVLSAFYVFVRYTKMWQMQNQKAIDARSRRLIEGGGLAGTGGAV